jgi:hypothetical protein
VPGKPVLASSELITVPIQLQNTANITITGLSISAEVDIENIYLSFSRTFFDELRSNSVTPVELRINRTNVMESFHVTVKASAVDPVVTDSAIITITSLVQEIEDEFRNVRDLLSSNPECLELNELMEEARGLIKTGFYEKAQSVLEDVEAGCRYLIANMDPDLESPEKKRRMDIIQNQRIWIILGISLLFLTIFIFVKRKNDQKYLENYT